MSLWWTQREQLDEHQIALIENLPLDQSYLICGPPGSGKTNVLLRRAQFVRSQDLPNVLVLTFTRPLVEFVKTGCVDAQGREIFPRACVNTLESWIRDLYEKHEEDLPPRPPKGPNEFREWKIALAQGALGFFQQHRLPIYDTLFVDEVQDLYEEELKLLGQWGKTLFLVGDARQKIFDATGGLDVAKRIIPTANQRILPFHYRMAPEVCRMADRILQATGTDTLSASCHYVGPKPARIDVNGPWSRDRQLAYCVATLKNQIRAYADRILQGDRLGIIVARRSDRDAVMHYLENDPDLAGKAKIVRSNDGTASDRNYDPSFDPERPISILTLQGCKGIEFRALHWLFCEQLARYHSVELYYTAVTRAKTSIDILYDGDLPQEIARSYSPPGKALWS